MAKAYKVIGTKVERVDGLERLIGEAKYVSDIYLPGMLYAKFLQSQHPHARVVKVDTSRPQTLPGVKLVLTAADVPGARIHGRPSAPTVLCRSSRRRPNMRETRSWP